MLCEVNWPCLRRLSQDIARPFPPTTAAFLTTCTLEAMSVLSSASIIDAMARLSPKDATALASLAERVAMGYIISQSHFVQCVKRELGSADLVFRALLLLRGEQSAPSTIPDSQALVLHARSCGNNACKVNGCTETKSMLATVRAHTASVGCTHRLSSTAATSIAIAAELCSSSSAVDSLSASRTVTSLNAHLMRWL